jgi:hypothetical protein
MICFDSSGTGNPHAVVMPRRFGQRRVALPASFTPNVTAFMMRAVIQKQGTTLNRIITTSIFAAAALVFTAQAQAKKGTPTEITLASPAQALAYCQAGSMGANDIAYINGANGLAQYGSAKNCAQQIPAKGKVSTALEVNGSTVSECKLVTAKEAVTLCNDGDLGEWNIDYIAGKIGYTISGPGYGCNVGTSTSGIGTALCK